MLRRSDFGEADRLLTLYSLEYGKLRAIAKGARKPQSRKTGHVELFMRSNFMLATGRTLDIVTQAETIEPLRELSHDLLRTTYAAYAVELLDNLTPEEEKHSGIYRLLVDSLERFARSDNLNLAARYFELRLLTLAGFQPQLFYDVVTGDPIEEADYYFSAAEGGLFDLQQRNVDRSARRLSAAAIKVLRFLQTRSWDAVANLQLRQPLQRELETVMHYYLAYLLEKQIKSADFLLRLRRESANYAA